MESITMNANCLRIPILEYSEVVERELDDMRYCTTVAKFKRDLTELVAEGFVALSLQDYISIRNGKAFCPEKAFCLIFVGGYKGNYSLAFPILRKLQIPASIFVATELVGAETYPRVKKLTPHFGWAEAQEMIDSGLVNIYPMWHPFDMGKEFKEEVKSKLNLLQSRLHDNGSLSVFADRDCSVMSLDCLQSLGIEINLTNFYHTNTALLLRGAAPTLEESFAVDVLDLIDQYRAKSLNVIHENEDALQIQRCCSMPESQCLNSSVYLPVDLNPRVRNYLRHAFPFSVLQTDRADKVDRILLREYIDLVYQPQRDWLDFHNELYESWECFSCRRMSRDILVANGINVIEYLINGLRAGYYADIWLDTYYVKGKSYYNHTHSTHGLLLYGYDAEKKVFLSLSYNKREIYETIEVPLLSISHACSTMYFSHVTLFKINLGQTVDYNFRDICNSLDDYLHSVCRVAYHRFSKHVAGQSVQYEACLRFADKIEQQIRDKGAISQVAMYSYGEHKRLMMWRLRKLCELEELCFPELEDACNQTEIATKWLLNACLKYNLTRATSTLESIIHTLKEQNEREKMILEHFLTLVDIKQYG